MRCAGVPLASRPFVGAAAEHTFSVAAAVFAAEALADRGGGAARHGARLLVSAAVFEAMRSRCRVCVAGASCKIARSICAMLGTDATSHCTSGAAFLLAHFPAATAVLAAPASSSDGSGALVERAEPFCSVFIAKPSR